MQAEEAVTNVTAVAAVTSPAWLPSLQQASEFAATMLPILGVTWLVVQITLKLHEWWKRNT